MTNEELGLQVQALIARECRPNIERSVGIIRNVYIAMVLAAEKEGITSFEEELAELRSIRAFILAVAP